MALLCLKTYHLKCKAPSEDLVQSKWQTNKCHLRVRTILQWAVWLCDSFTPMPSFFLPPFSLVSLFDFHLCIKNSFQFFSLSEDLLWGYAWSSWSHPPCQRVSLVLFVFDDCIFFSFELPLLASVVMVIIIIIIMVSCSQISKLCIIYFPLFYLILFCSDLAVQQMKLLRYLKLLPNPAFLYRHIKNSLLPMLTPFLVLHFNFGPCHDNFWCLLWWSELMEVLFSILINFCSLITHFSYLITPVI